MPDKRDEQQHHDWQKLQQKLLDEHLLRWFGDITQEILAADPPAFYNGVLELTETLLRYQSEAISSEK